MIPVSSTNSNQMTGDVMFGGVCVCSQAISTTTQKGSAHQCLAHSRNFRGGQVWH